MDIKKFQFCFLDEKLWLKEEDYKILVLNQIHIRKYRFVSVTIFIQYKPTGNFCTSGINHNQTCLFQILTVHGPLRENCLNPLGLEAKSDFDHRTSKIKSQSARAPKQYLKNKSPIHGQETESFFQFSAVNFESYFRLPHEKPLQSQHLVSVNSKHYHPKPPWATLGN